MKIENNETTTTTSSPREQHAMMIDASHMAHIINMLTDIYPNPIMAVLREYPANGIDAHVEAGNPNPVRVTLPTPLSPTLVIEDNGIGLTKEGIIKIFSQYGASTKRDTNEQIGGFGIGAKSAFAVSDQFTVQAVQGGQMTRVLFARDEQGATTTILAEQATDLPNGVKVSIPVDTNSQAYEREARELYYYWKPGTIEVTGQEFVFFDDHATKIADNVSLLDSDTFRKQSNQHMDTNIVVRMGGIAYTLAYDEIRQVVEDGSAFTNAMRRADQIAVLDIPIGSVNLVPSRESILFDEKAIRVLKDTFEVGRKHISDYFTRELREAKNMSEAIEIYVRDKNIIDAFCDGVVKYKGKVVPTAPADGIMAVSAHDGYKRMEVSSFHNWQYHRNIPIILVDTTGTKLPEGRLASRRGWGVEDRTGEYMAFHDARSGVIRRHLSYYMKSLIGKTVCGHTITGSESIVFMHKHEAAKDAYIVSRKTMVVTLAEIVEGAKEARKEARKTATPRAATGDMYEYSTDQGNMNAAQISQYKHIFYRHGWGGLGTTMGMKLPKSMVLVQLTNRQKFDAFAKRIEKAGGATPVAWSAFKRAEATRLVATLSEKDIVYLTGNNLEPAFRQVVEPIITDGLIKTGNFAKQARQIIAATQVAISDSRKVKIGNIRHLAREAGVEVPTAKNNSESMLEAYPVIAVFHENLPWHRDKITGSGNEELLATFLHVIRALDAYDKPAKAAKATKVA